MWQTKSNDDMFEANEGFDHSKNYQNKKLKSKIIAKGKLFLFSLKCLDFDCTPRKDATRYSVHCMASFVQLLTFYFEENFLSSITEIEIGSYKD